jgi:sugar/nucleoside kinase (ribokinase family)
VRAVHLPFYSLVSEPLGSASRRAVEMAREVVTAAVVSIDLSSAAPLRAFGVRAAARVIRSLAPDVLFANEGEASVFGARNRAEKLLELSPIVVIKQGRAGCEVLARGRGSEGEASVLRITVATRPIATSDTTGAGDAFDAGFLVSLLESVASPVDATLADLRRAAVAGNRAAAKLLTTPRAELTW